MFVIIIGLRFLYVELFIWMFGAIVSLVIYTKLQLISLCKGVHQNSINDNVFNEINGYATC